MIQFIAAGVAIAIVSGLVCVVSMPPARAADPSRVRPHGKGAGERGHRSRRFGVEGLRAAGGAPVLGRLAAAGTRSWRWVRAGAMALAVVVRRGAVASGFKAMAIGRSHGRIGTFPAGSPLPARLHGPPAAPQRSDGDLSGATQPVTPVAEGPGWEASMEDAEEVHRANDLVRGMLGLILLVALVGAAIAAILVAAAWGLGHLIPHHVT